MHIVLQQSDGTVLLKSFADTSGLHGRHYSHLEVVVNASIEIKGRKVLLAEENRAEVEQQGLKRIVCPIIVK